jgi:hypothetical protein
MRALFGVVLELIVLSIIAYVASALASWYPLSLLVLLLAQVLTTILVHCPAHYIVGRALGIRFSRIMLGRSTAVRVLPKSLKRIGSLLIVFTLTVDPESKKTISPKRLRTMFLAGVSGSLGSAVIFAFAVSLAGDYVAGLITWLFAFAYMATDFVFSPKAGDLMRARAVMARP